MWKMPLSMMMPGAPTPPPETPWSRLGDPMTYGPSADPEAAWNTSGGAPAVFHPVPNRCHADPSNARLGSFICQTPDASTNGGLAARASNPKVEGGDV